MKKFNGFEVGEQTWFKGEKITIVTEPYEMYGGWFQNGITESGKIVSVVPPEQKNAAAARSQKEWAEQQQQFSKLNKKEI